MSSRRIFLAAALLATTAAGCGEDEKCAPFEVYAQNRWEPIGAAVREEPDIDSERVSAFNGNGKIIVKGWLDPKEDVYPYNSDPWNSTVWFELANEAGYVAFAAVRAETSKIDETGGYSDYGGEPVELLANCEILDENA